jgi:putative transposase
MINSLGTQYCFSRSSNRFSDRGVQYASQAYTTLLRACAIQISMGRSGNPYDNAQVECFIRTLKHEGVYLFEYQGFSEACARISHFLEAVYNHKPLHSALGYLPPVEFEQVYSPQGEAQLPASQQGFTTHACLWGRS